MYQLFFLYNIIKLQRAIFMVTAPSMWPDFSGIRLHLTSNCPRQFITSYIIAIFDLLGEVHCIQDRTIFLLLPLIRTLHSHETRLFYTARASSTTTVLGKISVLAYIHFLAPHTKLWVFFLWWFSIARGEWDKVHVVLVYSYWKSQGGKTFNCSFINYPLLFVWAQGAQIVKGLVVPQRPGKAKAVHRLWSLRHFLNHAEIFLIWGQLIFDLKIFFDCPVGRSASVSVYFFLIIYFAKLLSSHATPAIRMMANFASA